MLWVVLSGGWEQVKGSTARKALEYPHGHI